MGIRYEGVYFKTRLEAVWATFFDLAGWEWDSNPPAVGDWKPDFEVRFYCPHSACPAYHRLLVSVLPIDTLENVRGHPALSYEYSVPNNVADAGALFGSHPSVSRWAIVHGINGGYEGLYTRIANVDALWAQAESMVPHF